MYCRGKPRSHSSGLRRDVLPNVGVCNLRWQAVGLRASPVLWNFVFERRRFRQFLPSLAEWCAVYWGKGGVDGRRLKGSGNGSFPPPPIFSPLVSCEGAHHSAANAVSERNPLRKITKHTSTNPFHTLFPRTPNGVRISLVLAPILTSPAPLRGALLRQDPYSLITAIGQAFGSVGVCYATHLHSRSLSLPQL